MKKVCFIEMEGVLLSNGDYSVDETKAKSVLKELSVFCKKNKINLYLISGFHEPVAHKKFDSSFLKDFFDEQHFLHVDEAYITAKAEADEKLHRDNLEKDHEFNDTYFKQVVIQQVLAEKNVQPKDALLLSDDLWVDGYYTLRFSKIDFALFEENILDRGNKTSMISGLAYFRMDFDSIRPLLENFPSTDTRSLDKYIFETMKKALIGDSTMSNLTKKILEKKSENK